MKIVGRSGGYWLFWTSATYLVIGLWCALYFKEIPIVLIQLIWLIALVLPFVVPSLGRWLNIDLNWDRKMFNFFSKRTAEDYLKEAKETYMVPDVKPVKPLLNEDALYMVGVNDQGMVQLRVGTPTSITLTMNNYAVRRLIKQLEAAMPEEEECQDEG
jgi:hypothetical protein